MDKSKSPKTLGSTGFTLGLVVGTPSWIVSGTFFHIGTNFGLMNGVANGIIIGSVCALALIGEWFGERDILVIPFGMGWGTLAGIAMGLLFAWSTSVSYLGAFSTGSTAGLVSGIMVGSLLWTSI